ncbi:Sensor protein FixL [compost metagenome]
MSKLRKRQTRSANVAVRGVGSPCGPGNDLPQLSKLLKDWQGSLVLDKIGNWGMKAPHTKTDNRTVGAIWAVIVFVLLVTSAGALVFAVRDYKSRMSSSEQSAINLARVLAEHTTQVFVVLNALSLAIIDDMSIPASSGFTLSEILKRRAAAEPAADTIAVVDSSGRVVASSSAGLPVRQDVTEMESFKVLSELGAPSTYVSRPYRTHSSTSKRWSGWTMNFARRIQTSDGSFNGIVLVTINGPFLYGFYDRMDENDHRFVGLVGEDGVIRISNAPEVIGSDLTPFIKSKLVDGSIWIAPAISAGDEMIFAHSKSIAAPLLAYVGTPTQPIYIAWLQATGVVAVVLVMLLGALLTLGTVTGRYIRNRASLFERSLENERERQKGQFLQSILDTGGALVAVTDIDGHFIVANPAFRQLFDIDDTVQAQDGDEQSLVEMAIGNTLPNIIATLPYQAQTRVVSPTGGKREISWTVTSIRDEEGVVKNLVAIGFDNTELREAELAIYQAGKLITLGEVATGIAHEINQPLAAISMALDNLRSRLEVGTSTSEFVDTSLAMMGRQVDRAASIVEHMRVFGHRSDGNPHAFDPAQAVEGALAIAGAQLRDSRIELRLSYQPGQYLVQAEITRIEQVLLNILLNARDAILHSRETEEAEFSKNDWIKIAISTSSQGKMVALTIADSGPGIAPSALDRLFEPFFTTKPIGVGMGLGLSLSYGIAKQFGGTLQAENTADGAKFTLLLPAA